ncbi:MAG: hypothetical protein M0T84_12615 [Betaproteobacteria bacterium]|nr:hypothetical protein [Betaproteobacteria bacterium]
MLRTCLLLLAIVGLAGAPAFGATLNPPPGRFEIVIDPHVRADTFLLDTQTGKIWRLVKYDDLPGKPVVWRFMDRIDNLPQALRWDKAHSGRERAAPLPTGTP